MDFQANIDETKQFTEPKKVILYVANLPLELSEEGVREIFNYYGKIVSLFYRPNISWAFITYETYREAESAIRDLHDVAPLYLQVSLKVKRSNNDNNTQKIESGKHTDIINKQEHQSPIRKHYENDEFLHPICTRSFPANSSTISKNSLWTRGTVTVTSDGKRHISYGRGYTLYKIPDPHPEIGTLIEQVYDKRGNVLYEHGQDSLKHMIGKCVYCARPSRTKCERCYYFYCTRECQEKDWPRHKYECQQKLTLIKDVTSLSISSSEEDVARSTSLSKQKTLRRPKAQAKTLLHKHAGITVNQHMDTINTKCSINNECQSNYEINNITQVNNDISKLTETESISNIDALQNKNDIAFIKTQWLSNKYYIKVEVVTILKDSNYCVFKIDQKEKIMQMKRSLSDIAMTTCKVNPVVGNLYVYKFGEEYHRVKIISTNPTTIYFIDYHVAKIADSDDFYKLNSTQVSFGIRITMAKANQRLHLNDIISVKRIYFKDNISVVDIKMEKNISDKNSIISSTKSCNIDESVADSDLNGSILSTNDKANKHNDIKKQNSKHLHSVINLLSEGECGSLKAYALLGNNSYGITLLPTKLVNKFNRILWDLPKYCNSVKQDKYRPKIGEIVCGKRTDDDAWLRGLLISYKPCKLAILDKVIIEPVQKVVPYPDFLRSICRFGVICNVITTNFKLQEQVHYKFEVLSCTNDITIKIYMDESKQFLNAAKAVIKPWVPTIGQCDIKFTELKTESEICGIKFAELKTESEICIVHFQNLTEIYAYSTESENVLSFHNIMQRVGILAQSAPFLKELPGVGEIVIAKYIDDNYYRAIVTNIKKEQVDIYFIDYGNTTTIPWKNLQVLSDDLKQEPPCITKIALKNIPTNVPVNKDVSDYFLDLIGREVHLLCHLEDLSSTNNVSLTLPNGESVNDKIKKLLIPSWEKDNEEDKTVYMFDDGSVDNAWTKGSTIEVIVLSIFKPGTDYVMCPADEDLVKHVYEILPPLINDYCKKAKYYIPRIGELCFGLYNGDWYRAYCIDPAISEKESQLFYLDYGNTEYVLHENIRAMAKDFLTPDFLANICTVVNLVPEDKHEYFSPNVLKRISELVSVSERVSIKIVEVTGKNQYIIELPQIRATLIKENLIS